MASEDHFVIIRILNHPFIIFDMMVLLTLIAGVDLSGKAYLGYYHQFNKEYSDFRVTRVYINFKAKVLETEDMALKFRFTPDIDYKSSGMYYLYTKYAYAELVKDKFHFYFGQHSTPYLGYIMKHYWKYRFIEKMAAHHYKLLTTADRGVSVKYSGNLFSTHLGIYTGEGYKHQEVSYGKDFLGRLTLNLPIEAARVQIHGYGQVGSPKYTLSDTLTVTDTRTIFGGALSVNFKGFIFYTEYFTSKNAGLGTDTYYANADVFSAFAVLPIKGNCLFVRYDIFGDSGLKTINNRYLLAGFVYRLSKKYKVALDYKYELNGDGTVKNQAIGLDMEVKF